MAPKRSPSLQPEPHAKRARIHSPRTQQSRLTTPNASRPALVRAQSDSPASPASQSPGFDRTRLDPGTHSGTEVHSQAEDAQPFIRPTDPGVVRVFVGLEKKLYLWHRKLLCAESPTMARRLERRAAWEVSVRGTPTVPTAKISDSIEAVDIVTKWLYDHGIALPTERSLIFDVYVCAVKLDLESLQNQIMDELQQLEMRLGGAGWDNLVRLLIHFNSVSSTMLMRDFLFDLAVFVFRQGRKLFSSLDDETLEALLKHQGLMKDLLLRTESGEDDVEDISWEGGRRYHKHTTRDGCNCMSGEKSQMIGVKTIPTVREEVHTHRTDEEKDGESTSDDSQVISCPRYIMELLTNSWLD